MAGQQAEPTVGAVRVAAAFLRLPAPQLLDGLDAARLRFESFDYAPDTLERHRTSSDTKS